MKTTELEERNRVAREKVSEFRKRFHPGNFGRIDQDFHRYKNRYPYFGFIDVAVGESCFVMFSGNDDLVAMTYFWHGPSSFESHSLELWSERVQDAQRVLDVGAFSGVYSLVAVTANPACTVTALEPSRRTHGRLLLNAQANGVSSRIAARALAASARVATLNLLQFRGENILGNGASLLEKDLPVTDGSEKVETIPIDALCHDLDGLPDLVKIDVEGAEIDVLCGMENTLSQAHPVCIVEVTPRTCPEVSRLLTAHGYAVEIIDDEQRVLRPAAEGTPRVANLLATPR